MSDPIFDSLMAAEERKARAPTTVSGDPAFDRLMAIEDQRQAAAMAGQLTTATQVNPDQYAEQRRVARQMGVAPGVVEASPTLADTAKVQRIYQDTAGTPVLRARAGDDVVIVLDHTPTHPRPAQRVREIGRAHV